MIPRSVKENLLNQRAKVIWFTGLSGSGKSTIALGLDKKLFDLGYATKVLDGDNVRTGISNNLSFTLEDRQENIRRIGEVSKLFCEAGVICINAFVSPTKEIRTLAKAIVGKENFIEIFVNTPLEICESRDVKGLYKKARSGEITGFTGIDSPYENPENPDLYLNTENRAIEDCVNQCFTKIISHIHPY